MIEDRRDGYYGYTVKEFISWLPNELKDLGGSLWQVLGHGRQGFGLSGLELDEFIRMCLIRLVELGGRPMVFDEATKQWHVETRYGRTPGEIADAVIAEWHAQGSPDLAWGEGPWFRSKDSE